LKSFFSNIGFTKNETRVVLLIIAVLIIGAGIKYYKYFFTGDNTKYDYSKSDDEFRKLTEDARKREFDAIKNDTIKPDDENKISEDMRKEQDSLESVEKEPKISKKELKLREKSINLNTAGTDELISLPGIGESTAEKIIEYRNRKGKFKKIQDIMNVKGIGEKKFEKIKEYLIIE
jgi:competence protein ComEA